MVRKSYLEGSFAMSPNTFELGREAVGSFIIPKKVCKSVLL